jgi:hypothetical protein
VKSASSFKLAAPSSLGGQLQQKPQRVIAESSPEMASRNGWKLGAGSWRVEAGGWKLEAGSWKLEAGGWKLEAGSWKLV